MRYCHTSHLNTKRKKKRQGEKKKHNQLPEMRIDGLQQASELGKEIYFAISVAFRAA
jgi:hypothetical protein